MKSKHTITLLMTAAFLPFGGFAEKTNQTTTLFGVSLTQDEETKREAAIAYGEGHAFFTGEGAEQDLAKAIEHYTKAAEFGHPQAQFNLGLCYMNGKGAETNNVMAAKWFRQAAAQDVKEALYPLGICHYNLENYTEAYAWALFAEEQSDTRLKEMLDPMYSEEEISAGKKRFEELKKALDKKNNQSPRQKNAGADEP